MTCSATVLYGRESFCEVQKLWSGSLSECSLSECHPRHLTVQSLDNTTTHEQLSLNNATTQEKCIGTAAQNPAVAIARPSYIARPSPLEGLLTRQRAHGARSFCPVAKGSTTAADATPRGQSPFSIAALSLINKGSIRRIFSNTADSLARCWAMSWTALKPSRCTVVLRMPMAAVLKERSAENQPLGT